MTDPRRDIACIVASTDHGMLIVNRYDQRLIEDNKGFGVGYELLNRSQYEPREVSIAMELLTLRRKYFGDGVKVIDCGANIGTHTVSWARHMTGWGDVLAIEAQERVFYQLCGAISINNCFNARAVNAAVGCIDGGIMRIPQPNYQEYGSFGSVELEFPENGVEFIGQVLNYSDDARVDVRAMTIDSLKLPRLDFIKIDVEGMELDVLAGAEATIWQHHPIIAAEALKTAKNSLTAAVLDMNYVYFPFGNNILAVHRDDPTLIDVEKRQDACGA